MKKIHQQIVGIAAGLLLPGSAWCGSWSPMTTVTTLYPNNDGSVYVWFNAGYNLDGCGSVLANVATSNLGFKNIYSAILAAKLANKNIQSAVGRSEIRTASGNFRQEIPHHTIEPLRLFDVRQMSGVAQDGEASAGDRLGHLACDRGRS